MVLGEGGMRESGNRLIIPLMLLILIGALTLYLSAQHVSSLDDDLIAKLECYEGGVELLVRNLGHDTNVLLISIVEGDRVVRVLTVNRHVPSGAEVRIYLGPEAFGRSVSFVSTRGVASGLTCGASVESQP